MHVFPQLRKLEDKYAGRLAVVGVHSAKFTAEKDSQNVRKAVLRYEIEHPVINDKDFVVWQQYAVRAWPTLMFVDPEGQVIGKHEGEIDFEAFDRLLGDMVSEFDEQGLLDSRPVRLKLERETEWERALSFPGKVLADPIGGRLFIADSNHNRVIVCSLDGHVREVIGSGNKGLTDGAYDEAAFNDPQGMALSGSTLYVADTKNHALRGVDLANRTVKTIAGHGTQNTLIQEGEEALTAPLRSPWDVAIGDGQLYIAMAGSHQLWRLDLETRVATPFAGNGRERIVDGPLARAELAQPSGIAVAGSKVFFTDSETSAVRSADIGDSGEVATIVGQGLFTFGDVDGIADEVRLQHPLGIDAWDGVLYVADSYNNKIKKVSPDSRETTTLLGSGVPGFKDGQGLAAEFHEPGGLSAADGVLYIADTNNHAIRAASLETGVVTTLEITGL